MILTPNLCSKTGMKSGGIAAPPVMQTFRESVRYFSAPCVEKHAEKEPRDGGDIGDLLLFDGARRSRRG